MVGGFNGGSQSQITRFSPVLDAESQLVSINILDEGITDQCVLSEARYSPTIVGTRDHGLLILGGVKRSTLNGEVVYSVSKSVEMYYPTLPNVETLLQQ